MREQLIKRVGRAVAVVTVVGLAALGLSCVGDTEPAPSGTAQAGPSDRAALTVTKLEIEPVEVARTITVDGSIFAWQEVIISPEVGGYQVAEVNVDVGDRVEKGQELVRLSSSLLDAEVASREAALKQREAELVNAQASLTRGQTLAGMDALSPADLDLLKSNALAAEARVESARADLDTSRLRLKFTHVRAPDDGIITSRSVTVGQVAQAGGEMLRLLRQGRVEWRGKVPEARLAELERGQPVTVTTADGTAFDGEIRIIAPTVADDSRTGLVYVDLEPDSRLRPGMFARGSIEISRGLALLLPLESIVSSDGYSYAFALRSDHTVERRRIETGAIHGGRIEVTSGLAAGESVVVKGAGFLKDDDLVNVAPSTGQETGS